MSNLRIMRIVLKRMQARKKFFLFFSLKKPLKWEKCISYLFEFIDIFAIDTIDMMKKSLPWCFAIAYERNYREHHTDGIISFDNEIRGMFLPCKRFWFKSWLSLIMFHVHIDATKSETFATGNKYRSFSINCYFISYRLEQQFSAIRAHFLYKLRSQEITMNFVRSPWSAQSDNTSQRIRFYQIKTNPLTRCDANRLSSIFIYLNGDTLSSLS